MTNKTPVRVAEDVDETALSYAEIKALATGNPLIIEKCQLEMDVGKLKILHASHLSQKYSLEDKILKEYPQEIKRLTERIAGYTADIETVAKYPADKDHFPPMKVSGILYAEKKEAGTAIIEACKAMTSPDPVLMGEYRGFQMVLSFDSYSKEYKVTLQGKHIEFMETQFAMVFSELQAVRSQLQTIEDKSVKATVMRIVDTVDVKVSEAKTQLVGIKDSMAAAFSNTVKAVEQKGVSALKGTLDFFKVHTALSFLKGKLGKAVDSLQKGIIQLENVKTEFHMAKTHAGNAGRLLLGKEAKAASVQNPERGVLAGVQKFLLRTSVLLTNIGKVADSAMRKIEGLGERSEKTSVDKSIKEIKTARTDSKTPVPERDNTAR